MTESKVFTTNRHNEKLVGIETSPSVIREKYPTVLLVHGFGSTKEEDGLFDNIAKHLVDNNLLVYRFDFSGCGESEGDFQKVTLTKLKNDLDTIIAFVKANDKVDVKNIGVLAQSFGTAITIALSPEIKAMLLMGSISDPLTVFKNFFGNGFNPDGVSTRTKSNGTTTEIHPQFWNDLNNYNLVNSIRNIKFPTLFLHGSLDDKVPVSEMEKYYNAANEPKKKIIIEGADHGLRPHWDKIYKLASDWFKVNLL